MPGKDDKKKEGERVALSAKQERFCAEYIVDYNGTRAAIRAGYSEASAATQASRMLKNDEVSARVRELQKIYNETHCYADKERVLAEAWELLAAASAAKPVTEWDYSEHKYVETGEYAIDGKTAAKALELIAKLGGMIKDKVAVEPGTEGAGEVKFSIEVRNTNGN